MKNLVGDILSEPMLKECEIALMDIDPKRLATSKLVAERIAAAVEARPKITATTERRRALEDADYVVLMIQVAGYKPGTVIDFEVPKKLGLRQTIADTLGIGGIMRGLRTAPVLIDIARDMIELCPHALMLQYVNPMVMNCASLSRVTPQIRTVGLCHSVQGTAKELAADIGVDPQEIRYLCAGINHMAFYLKFERRLPDGSMEDLYPRIAKVIEEKRVPDWNRVRYEVFRHFGYFVTESSEHFSEYVPWFIKRDRPDLIERYGIPLDEYPRRCVEQIEGWKKQADAYRKTDRIELSPSREYASEIINAMVTGEPATIYGNVENRGLITSLPDGAAVEVPCVVDRSGLHPQTVGALPPQLTALIRTNINVQELTVAALVEGNPARLYQAAMMDPHTGAELDLDQIWALTGELIRAHGDLVPAWAREPLPARLN
jgi:alpha-galactosidase